MLFYAATQSVPPLAGPEYLVPLVAVLFVLISLAGLRLEKLLNRQVKMAIDQDAVKTACLWAAVGLLNVVITWGLLGSVYGMIFIWIYHLFKAYMGY